MATGRRNPDPLLIDDLRRIVSIEKSWISSGPMVWVDAGGRPKGFKLREHLALHGGLQPATLFVDLYLKHSSIPGASDKLSISLFYRNFRVLGIDENWPSRHFNEVGIGRPYFKRAVDHPHLHTVCDDGIEGYAEPISSAHLSSYWQQFVSMTNIVGAPEFTEPTTQLDLQI